jgi:hypothetical protein
VVARLQAGDVVGEASVFFSGGWNAWSATPLAPPAGRVVLLVFLRAALRTFFIKFPGASRGRWGPLSFARNGKSRAPFGATSASTCLAKSLKQRQNSAEFYLCSSEAKLDGNSRWDGQTEVAQKRSGDLPFQADLRRPLTGWKDLRGWMLRSACAVDEPRLRGVWV